MELDVRTLFDAGDSRLLPRAFPLLQQALATIPKGSALHMEVTFAGKRITYQHPASRHALAAQRARAIREALDHLGYTVAIIDIDEDPTSSASPATTIFKFCPSE
ncbi:MAG: hypothetical protein SFZ23_13295 [Planctomycetota bacterium]|nr:hypothetical protein [Planctomycetota bacterium]